MRFRNVNFKAVVTTLGGSLVAMVAAAVLVGVYVPSEYVRWYIGTLAIFMGLFVIAESYGKIRPTGDSSLFSKWKCALLGGVIGFNKGGTGGGYGPLSVSGYMLLGLPAAVAIGTTTVAEGIVCLIGVMTYASTIGVALELAVPMTIGSAIADPISAWVNSTLRKKTQPRFHERLVGVAMTLLGLTAVLKLIGLF